MAPRFAGDKLNSPEFLAVRDTISFAEGTWDEKNNRPGYGYRFGDAPGSGGSLDITAPHPIEHGLHLGVVAVDLMHLVLFNTLTAPGLK